MKTMVLVILMTLIYKLYAHCQVYYYEKTSSDKLEMSIMEITLSSNTAIVVNKERGTTIKSVFKSENYWPLFFLLSSGTNYSAEWNYENNSILINGKRKELKETFYINTGSLFFVFQKTGPSRVGEKKNYNLLSPDGNIAFSVVLEYLKDEQIEFQNSLIQCRKFEMKLQGIAGIFWPYSYYYWYSLKDGYLVRYEGPEAAKNIEKLELVKKER